MTFSDARDAILGDAMRRAENANLVGSGFVGLI